MDIRQNGQSKLVSSELNLKWVTPTTRTNSCPPNLQTRRDTVTRVRIIMIWISRRPVHSWKDSCNHFIWGSDMNSLGRTILQIKTLSLGVQGIHFSFQPHLSMLFTAPFSENYPPMQQATYGGSFAPVQQWGMECSQRGGRGGGKVFRQRLQQQV